MSTGVMSPRRAKISEKTLRTDRWWLAPLLTASGLIAWITYATVRVFMQDNYWAGQNEEQEFLHYLTPFYSPCVSEGCIDESSMFGQFLPDVWWLPYAALTLPLLLLFRLTCYYYRKAYYRSFWLSPPACAVAEPHSKYTGETRFPLLGQNLHRYFFYGAVAISLINTWDAIVPLTHGEDGGFGIGLGNLVLLVNVVMLWAYTASCHSCRSVIGGRLTHFSKHPVRYKMWGVISKLNTRHMELAWVTLLTLALTDFYVMLVASGTINDLRFFN
jgi:hypothetical protein